MRKILPLFSYLFHPIFIPLMGTLAWLYWGDSYFAAIQKSLIVLQIVIITILIPISFFYLLKTLGKIDSVMVSDLSQRKAPLIIQMVLTVILLKQSITIDRIPELFFFFAGGLVSTFLILVLLFFRFKTSIHMTGISLLTVFIIGLSLHYQLNLIYPIALLILLNGTIWASRLEMKAHTTAELTVGFFTGAIPQLLLFYVWL